MISLKTLVTTLLAATAATAAPSVEPASRNKRFAGGWCTFHLVEDAKFTHDAAGPDHHIQMTFYDGNGDKWYRMPQRQLGDDLQGVKIEFPINNAYSMIMNSLKDGIDGYIKGWEIKYNGETFTTNEEGHCSVGEEVVRLFFFISSYLFFSFPRIMSSCPHLVGDRPVFQFFTNVVNWNRNPLPFAKRGVTTAGLLVEGKPEDIIWNFSVSRE